MINLGRRTGACLPLPVSPPEGQRGGRNMDARKLESGMGRRLALIAVLPFALVPLSGPGNAANPGSGYMHLAQAPAKRSEPPTRPARSSEVKVQVLMLSDKVTPNPEENIEANGSRYIYFNSPQLTAQARPLMEPKLRFPGDPERKNGAVILQLLISEAGALEGASIVCAARGFAKSALESVTGLKFRPARDKSGPVKSYMLVEFGYGSGFPCIPAPFY